MFGIKQAKITKEFSILFQIKLVSILSHLAISL